MAEKGQEKGDNRRKTYIGNITRSSTASVTVLGIDPGMTGAMVRTDGATFAETFAMPLDPERLPDFGELVRILDLIQTQHASHVFLERAIPMAMGAKGAFSYGRGFQNLLLAILQSGMKLTMVEPSKWTKEMHEGISSDLKPKAKSLIAVQRLYPRLVDQLPRKPKGGFQDGPVDALLIAGYGLRRLGIQSKDDFF